MFNETTHTLQQASALKLNTICKKLNLEPSDHVVEIGTGWGGFAIYAGKHYGCQVTTITISKQQHDCAKAKIAEAGLQDLIHLRFDDYRDLTGQFDKLVSIEMVEAVGHQYYDTYFFKVRHLLKPNGMALIQCDHDCGSTLR